jgi:hypothetical protein
MTDPIARRVSFASYIKIHLSFKTKAPSTNATMDEYIVNIRMLYVSS